MTYSSYLGRLPTDLKNLFRKFEKVENSIINSKWSMFFNKTCLKEQIWPTYTKIYLNSVLSKILPIQRVTHRMTDNQTENGFY